MRPHLIEHHPALGQIELEGLARLAGSLERRPARPERPQRAFQQRGRDRVRLIVDRGLRILVGEVRRDPQSRACEPPRLDLSFAADRQVAGERGAVFALLERADVGREPLGQHRHDAIGEVDAVAALPRLAIDRRSGPYVERHVGDRDDRAETARIGGIVVRRRPHRVVVIPRVRRIDRDDRQVRQVLALVAERQGRHPFGFGERLLRHHVGDAELVDRDQAERSRLERIAEPLGHARGDPRRPAGLLGEDEVTHLRQPRIRHRQLAPVALVDGLEPQPLALAVEHAEHQRLATRQRLHRMRDETPARFLGAREDAIARAERRSLAALDHAQPRRRPRLRLPALRHRDDTIAIGIDDAQHRHLRHAARLVEGATWRGVDQPLVRHVLEQRLERDLVRAR